MTDLLDQMCRVFTACGSHNQQERGQAEQQIQSLLHSQQPGVFETLLQIITSPDVSPIFSAGLIFAVETEVLVQRGPPSRAGAQVGGERVLVPQREFHESLATTQPAQGRGN